MTLFSVSVMFTNDTYLATSACHHNVTKPSDSCHVQSVTIMSPNLHSCHVQSVTIMSPNLHSCHVQSDTLTQPCSTCHHNATRPSDFSHVQSVTTVSPLHQNLVLINMSSYCYQTLRLSPVQPVTIMLPDPQPIAMFNLSQ